MSDATALGIVVGHGAMAEGLVSAVRRIAGDAADGLRTLSNEGKGPDELGRELEALAGEARTVVFVDLRSGSCGMAAFACCKDSARRVVVCGVNLPMLLEFVFHREDPLEELVDRLIDKGRAAVVALPAKS